MPIFEFTSPDGKVYEVEGPEGATKEQAFQILQGQLSSQPQERKQDITLPQAMFGDKTMGDYAQGRVEAAKEMVDTEYLRGIIGQITQPLPPVNLADLSKQPTGDMDSAKNEALGMVMGMGPTSPMSALQRAGIKNIAAPKAQTVKESTFEAAGKLGLKVPREYVKPGAVSNIGSRLGGRQGIETAIGENNKEIVTAVARKELGVAPNTPITEQLLTGIRQQASKAYKDVEAIGTIAADTIYKNKLGAIINKYSGTSASFPALKGNGTDQLVKALNVNKMNSRDVLEVVKSLRNESRDLLAHNSSAAEKAAGRVKYEVANALDSLLERGARKALTPDKFSAYKAARQMIAKTYTIQNSLNPGTGDVVATGLLNAMKHGDRLSGDLKTVAQFAAAVPSRVANGHLGGQVSGGFINPAVAATTGAAAGGGGLGSIGAAAVPIVGQPLARKLMSVNPAATVKPSIFDPYLMQRLIAGTGGSNQ